MTNNLIADRNAEAINAPLEIAKSGVKGMHWATYKSDRVALISRTVDNSGKITYMIHSQYGDLRARSLKGARLTLIAAIAASTGEVKLLKIGKNLPEPKYRYSTKKIRNGSISITTYA